MVPGRKTDKTELSDVNVSGVLKTSYATGMYIKAGTRVICLAERSPLPG